MLIYSRLGPRQSFHIDGSGAGLLCGAEQKLTAVGSPQCFCLLLFREVETSNVCIANMMLSLCDTCQSRAGLWAAPGEKSEHGLGCVKALARKATALGRLSPVAHPLPAPPLGELLSLTFLRND